MTDHPGPDMTPQWGPPPQATGHTLQYGAPSPSPQGPKRAWWKASWVAIAAAAVLGLGIGGAAGGSQSSTVTKTVTVTAPPLPAVTSVKPATVDEQAALDARSAAVAQREAAAQPGIDAKNSAADARSAALDQREAALVVRERAVGAQEATIAAGTIPGNGVFLVGKDVKAGTYRTTGPNSSGLCYWQRSRDASGTDIIANDIVKGPSVVNIMSSDVAFKSGGCANWTLVH